MLSPFIRIQLRNTGTIATGCLIGDSASTIEVSSSSALGFVDKVSLSAVGTAGNWSVEEGSSQPMERLPRLRHWYRHLANVQLPQG